MAAALAEVTEVSQEEVGVCSVCRDPTTRDPRLLDCGHHFCKCCLEKLVQKNTIKCPTCRYTTHINNGVSGMLMYRATNIFSTKVKQAIEGCQDEDKKVCEECEEKKAATRTCMECWLSLCDNCAHMHSTAENIFSHKTYPVSPHMFCTKHNLKGVLFYCATCKEGCCPHCLNRNHQKHQLEKVDASGQKARERLVSIRKSMDEAQAEETVSKKLQCLLENAKQVQETFKQSIKSVKNALTDLSAKLDKVCEELPAKMVASIKTLEMMSTDIDDYMASKSSLRELLTYLIEGASSPEVVIREKELPKYDKTTYKQMIRQPEVEISAVGDTLSEIKSKLNRCQQDLDIAPTEHSVCGPQYDTTKPDMHVYDRESSAEEQDDDMGFGLFD